MIRTALFRVLLLGLWMVLVPCTQAQVISGVVHGQSAADRYMVLRASRGSITHPMDSVHISENGAFLFPEEQHPTGFYELALNDSDRVDVILDARERQVEIEFSGIPLQRHIVVKRSDENKRLWEYKLVSKESQAVQTSVMAEKKNLQLADTKRMLELDSIAAKAIALQQSYLKGVIDGHPKSYFGQVVKADRALDDARGLNPLAVLKAFNFSDPGLMRSSLYDKAVLTFLRNIQAVSEEQFISATDSLLIYAGHDPECRAYMLDHLIDLFSTYGPELALQHLIDHYVVSSQGLATIDPGLRAKVKDLLKVTVGADAPDVDLPTQGDRVALRTVVEQHVYTVLFFYSSTCDHCHEQMPGLKASYATFAGKGVEVIGVALDGDSTEFQKGIAENGLTWPCYSEFNGWGSKVVKAFQVHATPFFYVLDQRMRIAAKPVDASDLERFLQEHLK
jgi:peroxiredoxin